MNKIIIISIFFLAAIGSFGCGTHKAQFSGTPFDHHTTAVGTEFTQQRLDSLTRYLDENLETTGMIILQDGKVLFEYGDVQDVGYIASCRKSILSLMFGKYVEDGTIDLSQTIGEIGIDEEDGLLEIEKSATVDHILTARSGVFHQPANGGYDKYNVKERGSVNPGEYFLYNNWDFNVAGAILEMKTGRSVYEELEEQLAIPLGFQDWNIQNQKKRDRPNRSRYPAYHMYISTRDFAKIGQLMLNEGEWQGEQLVPSDWIKKITATVTSVDTVNARYGREETSEFQFSYGYMWWKTHSFKQHPDFEGAYHATGWGGQFLTIIPKLNLVIAHKYAVPVLVNWGLKSGGVTNYEYWTLLYNLISGELD